MHVPRRQVALGLGSVLFAGAVPVSSAHAQAAILAKLPWGNIINGLTLIFTAMPVVNDWISKNADSRTAICGLTYSDAGVLEIRCLAVALTLSSTSAGPVQPPTRGDRGLIPALQAYSEEPSSKRWKYVKQETLLMLDASAALMSEVQRKGAVLLTAYPGAKPESVAILANTLEDIRLSIVLISMDDRPAYPYDVEAATQTLHRVLPLPELAYRALQSSRMIVAQRVATSCK